MCKEAPVISSKLSRRPALVVGAPAGARTRAIVLVLTVLAGALTSAAGASAQQTLFNVPTAQTAAVGHIFLQNQLTFGRSGDTDVTMDVGLTKNLEVGLNVTTIPLYQPPRGDEADGRAPNVVANAQWTVALAKVAHLQLGTWQGIATGRGPDDRADYAGRGHTVLRLGEDDARYGNYLVGVYAGSKTVLGPGSRVGGMLGVELPLIGKLLKLAGDWVVGTNAESVAAVGLESAFDAGQHWEVAVAAQLPSPQSGNDYGFILQISHIPIESPAK